MEQKIYDSIIHLQNFRIVPKQSLIYEVHVMTEAFNVVLEMSIVPVKKSNESDRF